MRKIEANKVRVFQGLKSPRNIKALTKNQLKCYLSWQNFERFYDIEKEIKNAVAGRLSYMRPEPPENPKLISGWDLPYEEQIFPYLTQKEKDDMEVRMDEDHREHYLFMEFIEEEWDRRKNGFWFYNGGRLEYITGRHYMFLQYWMIPIETGGRNKIGNPRFLDSHRIAHYALEIVRKDHRSCGLLFYTYRRWGKSIVALSDGFWDTTEFPDQRMTMQSKNEKDSKSLFLKLVESWKRVPAFFKPLDNEDSNPQTVLRFSQKKKQSKVSDREYSKGFLNGFIRHDVSKESALDGLFFSFIVQDEIGKAPAGLDVNERHNVNKECLFVGTKKVGYTICTSTIEDMEKYASKEAEILWDRSNTDMADPDMDRTDSGLYRLFLPAYLGLQGNDKHNEPFVDKYGYTDIKRSYGYIKSMYEFKKGNDLLSFRRKYPLTINDSFALADAQNSFSKERLLSQREFNNELSVLPIQKGNFAWKDGVKDSEVVFYPDEDGRWELSWMPPVEDRNKFEMRGVHRFPTRSHCVSGTDPFDATYVSYGGSEAASLVALKHHPSFPDMDNAIVCKYLYRQQYPEDFYEDMIMQSVFYSLSALIENNKDGVITHFRRRGYDGYLMKDPLELDSKKRAQPKKGIAMTSSQKRADAIDSLQAFIFDNIGENQVTKKFGYCPYNDLLDEALRFDAGKWTIYDSTVAFMLTSLALKGDRKQKVIIEEAKIEDYFPTFRN